MNNLKPKLNKIFNEDGRSFVMAMDHALMMPSPDITSPQQIIEKAVNNGVDAFLTSYGIVKNFHDSFDGAGIILRADGGISTLRQPMGELELLYTPEDAQNIGADAMLCMGYPGSQNNEHTLKYLAKLCAMGDKFDIPIGAEMLPYGFEKHDGINTRSVDKVSFACRQGCELGADFIKTEFVGGEEFASVIENSYSPVLVLGGAKAKSTKEIFQNIRWALDFGASGIIMGRNILRHKDIGPMCRAIAGLIHDGISVEEALKIFDNYSRYLMLTPNKM